MVEAFTARSGLRSLKVNGVALHSPYDPAREARRFVSESLRGEPPAAIVVLGEGLGYATEAAAERFPGARILSVRYSAEIAGLADRPAAWSPDSGEDLGGFLRRSIGELDIEGLRVIEWPVSARLFPEASLRANAVVREVVRELAGSIATTAAMGRLWLRNCIWNFVCIDTALRGSLCDPRRPIVIAASGPRLREALPALADTRGCYDLWALPSAAACLEAGGLAPDLVVATDGSYWAMVHMHFRRTCCPLAMSLSAGRGAWRAGADAFFLAQQASFERELLAAAGLAPPRIDPHGTVAATALELALAATSGPVIFAGLDLSAADLLSHALPNAFDRMLAAREQRLAPRYSASYGRARTGEASTRLSASGRIRISRALDTYAPWLSRRACQASGRTHRLLPSPVELPGFKAVQADELCGLFEAACDTRAGTRLVPDHRWPKRDHRLELAIQLLRKWERHLLDGALEATSLSDSSVADLAWALGARQLIEARRRGRLGDARGASEKTRELVDDGAAFLRSLRDRLERQASA